jgi:hypothetical protein
MQHRALSFRSSQEVLDEIDRLERVGYVKGKNWSLSQNCEHIGKTLAMGMHGAPFRLPWLLRKTIGPMVVGWIVRHGRMPGMLKLSAPKPLLPKPVKKGDDDPARIEWCRSMIREADAFAGPLPPYPLMDDMKLEDWKMLNWIHAGHHLGYLIPKGENP